MSVQTEYIVTVPARRSAGGKQLGVRLAEALFRRWFVLVLPIVLLTGLGTAKAMGMTGKYQSVGTVSVVSATFLETLSNVRPNTGGYESPAMQTARSINEQLTSDAFARDVAETAGLTTAMQQGQITLDQVRKIVYATPQGDTLLAIVASSDNPELSSRLASSLITTYTNFLLARETGGSNSAAEFWQGQVGKYTQAVDAAQKAIDDFIAANPAPAIGTRPEDQTLKLNNLNDQLATAQKALADAQGKVDDATLATETSQSDIGQRLQVVDEPQTPVAAVSVKRDQAVTLAVFLFLGGLIAIGIWVSLALIDHAVRSVGDLSAQGLAVVATIHRIRPLGGTTPKALTAGASTRRRPPAQSTDP